MSEGVSRVEATYKTLETIFGAEFVQKYKEARAKAEQLAKERALEIAKRAIEIMKNTGSTHARVDDFDVILAETPANPDFAKVTETRAGNFKVGMIWAGSDSPRGPWISVFVPLKDQAESLVKEAGKLFLLVGKLRSSTYEGSTTYNFRALSAISVDELKG